MHLDVGLFLFLVQCIDRWIVSHCRAGRFYFCLFLFALSRFLVVHILRFRKISRVLHIPSCAQPRAVDAAAADRRARAFAQPQVPRLHLDSRRRGRRAVRRVRARVWRAAPRDRHAFARGEFRQVSGVLRVGAWVARARAMEGGCE